MLIRNLIDSTSKGGNFVLNVGPTASGEFPAEHVALINTIGAWMDVNGAAIYGTSPAPEVETPVNTDFVGYATKKDQHIFLHVVKWPDAQTKQIVKIARTNLVKAELLDPKLKGFSVSSTEANGSTTLEFQRPENIDPHATVIQLTFKPE